MRLEVATGTRYQTKQDLVYTTLRNGIMRCDLAPGKRLVIEDIAQQLSVSPIPVREALHLLQSEGLVEMTPHVGATVARIAPSSIVEVFTILEGLEVVATRTAAQRLTPDSLQRLTRILSEMDEAVHTHTYEQWADLNSKLHRAISSIAGMPMLQEMTARVFDRWDRIRRFYYSDVFLHRLDVAHHEHHAIVAAMRDGEYEQLERLVKQHNQGALEAYTEYVVGHPVA